MAQYSVKEPALQGRAPFTVDWRIKAISEEALQSPFIDVDDPFILPELADFHTSGLNKYPTGRELQLCLDLPPDAVKWIINSIAFLIQSGVELKAGDYISDVFEDCLVRLDEHTHDIERDAEPGGLLRIVIPDSENRWPEDTTCDTPYAAQLLPTSALYHNEQNPVS